MADVDIGCWAVAAFGDRGEALVDCQESDSQTRVTVRWETCVVFLCAIYLLIGLCIGQKPGERSVSVGSVCEDRQG